MADRASRRSESDLSVAVRAAHAAGELALRHFNAKSEWWDKSPGNPVGIADLEVDAYLKDRLLGHRPDDGWLSEETADTDERLEQEPGVDHRFDRWHPRFHPRPHRLGGIGGAGRKWRRDGRSACRAGARAIVRAR